MTSFILSQDEGYSISDISSISRESARQILKKAAIVDEFMRKINAHERKECEKTDSDQNKINGDESDADSEDNKEASPSSKGYLPGYKQREPWPFLKLCRNLRLMKMS